MPTTTTTIYERGPTMSNKRTTHVTTTNATTTNATTTEDISATALSARNRVENYQGKIYSEYVALLQQVIDGVSVDMDEIGRLSLLLGKNAERVEADIRLLDAFNTWKAWYARYPEYSEQKTKAKREYERLRKDMGKEIIQLADENLGLKYAKAEEEVISKYRPDMYKQRALMAQAEDWMNRTSVSSVDEYALYKHLLLTGKSNAVGKPRRQPKIRDLNAYMPTGNSGSVYMMPITASYWANKAPQSAAVVAPI